MADRTIDPVKKASVPKFTTVKSKRVVLVTASRILNVSELINKECNDGDTAVSTSLIAFSTRFRYQQCGHYLLFYQTGEEKRNIVIIEIIVIETGDSNLFWKNNSWIIFDDIQRNAQVFSPNQSRGAMKRWVAPYRSIIHRSLPS